MAEALALEYARDEIRARVYDYWQGLSARERLAATEEYLGKYGQLLLGHLAEGRCYASGGLDPGDGS